MLVAQETLNKDEFYLPLNFPDPRYELLDDDIHRVMALKGSHPFFDAENFKIPNSIINLFKRLNLTIDFKKSFMFKLEGFDMGPIHLDGDPALKKLRPHGLNFSWGSEKTLMQWFENTTPMTKYLYKGIVLPHYDPATTKMLYSEILTGANLVNLTYPHRVRNLTPDTRLSISIGIQEELTWQEYKSILEEHKLVLKNDSV